MSSQLPSGPFNEKFKEVLELLQSVFQELAIPNFLIGALARDIHFHRNEIAPVRRTEDIDLAVLVHDLDQFKQLKGALKEVGFHETELPYRIEYAETIIDILPVGEIESNHTIYFKDSKEAVSVMGLKEIVSDQYNLTQVEGLNLPIISIESLFILKLISFQENWPERHKDLDDVWELLSNYWEIMENEILKIHYDLLSSDDFNQTVIAARVLGREIAPIVLKSKVIKEKILEILENETSAKAGRITKILAQKLESKEIEEARSYLTQILAGIRETIDSS